MSTTAQHRGLDAPKLVKRTPRRSRLDRDEVSREGPRPPLRDRQRPGAGHPEGTSTTSRSPPARRAVGTSSRRPCDATRWVLQRAPRSPLHSSIWTGRGSTMSMFFQERAAVRPGGSAGSGRGGTESAPSRKLDELRGKRPRPMLGPRLAPKLAARVSRSRRVSSEKCSREWAPQGGNGPTFLSTTIAQGRSSASAVEARRGRR